MARVRSSRRVSGLLAALMLGACTTGPISPSAQFLGTGNPAQDFAVPTASMEERRFATVVRQRYDFSCGSAALATLLRYHYALSADEESVFRGMWRNGDQAQIRRLGFSLLDMKRYLASYEMTGNGYKVSLEKVAEAGVPGVVLLNIKNYHHFVVVKGVNDREVLVGDPSLGLRTMSRTEFLSAWNGVYFVLGKDAPTRPTFNEGRQWAAFSRAPVGARFYDPLSQQALMLTAPALGDF